MSREQARVEIDAPPESVFAVLVEDRTDFSRNDEVLFRERVGDDPMGIGYRYKTTFLHHRHRCVTHVRISDFESPRIIEDEYFNRCEVNKRSVEGTLRYELTPSGTGTLVVATKRRRLSGFLGWLSGLSSSRTNLQQTLEVLASRVEARYWPNRTQLELVERQA
jgi:hypothetical protein